MSNLTKKFKLVWVNHNMLADNTLVFSTRFEELLDAIIDGLIEKGYTVEGNYVFHKYGIAPVYKIIR